MMIVYPDLNKFQQDIRSQLLIQLGNIYLLNNISQLVLLPLIQLHRNSLLRINLILRINQKMSNMSLQYMEHIVKLDIDLPMD